MYSAKGGQIMRLKYVPIYSQYKNNIFWILKTAISKNDMELTGTCGMSDDDTVQICGIFHSLYYQRFVSPNEARDFHSGKCKSYESFEKGMMPTCLFADKCGAYARVLEQIAADEPTCNEE